MFKARFIRFLLLFFSFSFTTATFAQSVKVELSKDSVIENSVTYYLHEVQKGQNLYRIRIAYGVSEAQIIALNPDAAQGIKPGQILRIPKTSSLKKGGVAVTNNPPKAPQGYINHKIKAGETLYSISKLYKIKITDIQKANPNIGVVLKTDAYLLIPKNVNSATDSKNAIATNSELLAKYDSIFVYTLKRRDNFYRLKKKFGVSQEQIEELNPEIKGTGLQKGMEIKLPYFSDLGPAIEIVNAQPTDQIIERPLTDTLMRSVQMDTLPHQGFRVGFVMPFHSTLEADIRTDNAYYMQEPSTYPSFKFIKFYEGFLMAVDSLEALGLHGDVFTFDNEADTNKTEAIVNSEAFKNLDLVVGPLFKKNLDIVLPKAKENHTQVVSPFSTASGLESFDNLWVMTPRHEQEIQQAVAYTADSLSNNKVFLVHNGRPSQIREANNIKRAYYRAALSGKLDTNNIIVYNYKNGGLYGLFKLFNTSRKNIIFSVIDNEAFVSNFVRQLNIKRDDYKMQLMGFENNWKKFKTIELEYLVNLELCLVSPYFINYQQKQVQEFAHLFYEKYFSDPDMMAYMGFDIGMLYLKALHYFGPDFTAENLSQLKQEGLLSKYVFYNVKDYYHQNHYANIYTYKNYNLVDKKRVLIPYVVQPINKDQSSEDSKPKNNVEK